MQSSTLSVSGMTCAACASRVEAALLSLDGVENAQVNLRKAQVKVSYDARVSKAQLSDAITQAGYSVSSSKDLGTDIAEVVAIILIAFAVWFIASIFGLNVSGVDFPLAESGMGYVALFMVGLLTSVHCVAMCGGLTLGQCIPAASVHGAASESKRSAVRQSLKPALGYNLGRLLSYTLAGFLLGALGSALSLSSGAKAAIQLIAGAFMVLMALSMLGVVPGLASIVQCISYKLGGTSALRAVARFSSSQSSPFVVGLLSALMPCGPLQAMEVLVIGIGNPLVGALSMFCFVLGTIPLMFAVGALAGVLTRKFTQVIVKIGAALVLCMGLFMFYGGWSLAGLPSLEPIDLSEVTEEVTSASGANAGNVAVVGDGVQTVETKLSRSSYPKITVKTGVPVKWTLAASSKTLTSCNSTIVIPEWDIEQQLSVGDNVIEFTPTKAGTYTYTCWMGMIRSTITVVDEL